MRKSIDKIPNAGDAMNITLSIFEVCFHTVSKLRLTDISL